MNKNSKIYVAGHRGLVGSAIVKNLVSKGYTNIITRTHKELDLINQKAVEEFFEKEKPEYVILAAAKVGGIVANNTYRADFIYENLQIQNNVIHQSYVHKVKKLLSMFEEKQLLYDILHAQKDESLAVTIGQENKYNDIKDCSIISATYHLDGKPIATLAVLGPTRMDYGKIISLLKFMNANLADIFHRFHL